jgi:SAM-dependent methyltransferase
MLRTAGAAEVLGVDLDERHVGYARRRYPGDCVRFAVADCERLDFPPASFELIVSSNVMEHLERPAAFLAGARQALAAKGLLLVAVPWIIDEDSRRHSGTNEFHRSNLTANEWAALFRQEGWSARVWLQSFRLEAGIPDFFDPTRTSRGINDFHFFEVALDDVRRPWPLGLLYRLDPL